MIAHPTPLKILHLVHSLEPGGMENGIANLANALDPTRFEIHVCCLERSGPFANRLPFPSRVSVLGKKPGFSPVTCISLWNELRRVRPHILHTHSLGALIYGTLASLGGFAAPILHGEHAELTADELTPRRLRQRRILYSRCRAVHSVSKALDRQLLQLGFPPEKLQVTLNGVDTTRFAPGDAPAARRALQIPEPAIVFGIVGRFGPFKRHRLLIEAFEIAADQNSQLHLLMVGGGGPEEAAVCERQHNSRHAGRIHLCGFQQDTRPFYQALDLLVAPSVNEGLSNAVLEAMACGVPVLAHDACGNSDIIDHGVNGFLANITSAEMLATELCNAAQSADSLVSAGIRARERVLAQFSLEKMVRDYETLYLQTAR